MGGVKILGAKANNTDSYRGITLFPTLCKIYEMVLLNRLEKFAADRGYFSELQFGFREGVGCIEASFTILETINHMLERGSKVFSCFLDVRKAFDTVWIEVHSWRSSLLQMLSNHCYEISINSLSLPAPSFADDVTFIVLFPSFLKTFLNICHQYSVTWRYEFNHTKSGVVAFGETKLIHSR